jgi:ribosomal protein S18 acetylase RimI-like enzyme
VVQQQSQSISVRRATGEDAPQILACLRSAFQEYRRFYTSAAFLDTVLTPETIRERLAKFFVFVAVDDSSEVVGTIACNVVCAEEGHLRGRAVLPRLRCAEIAAQLLSRAETELRSLGTSRITLDTTEPLQRARRFYEKFGYQRSGKATNFFGMPLIEYHKFLSVRDTPNR